MHASLQTALFEVRLRWPGIIVGAAGFSAWMLEGHSTLMAFGLLSLTAGSTGAICQGCRNYFVETARLRAGMPVTKREVSGGILFVFAALAVHLTLRSLLHATL